MKRKTSLAITVATACIALSGLLIGWSGRAPAVSDADIRKSVSKSLLLLQKSGSLFIKRNAANCASCHHNTLTSMAAGLAKLKGIPMIDSLAAQRIKAMEENIIKAGDPSYINEFVTANFLAPYTLVGLYGERYAGNLYTDISVNYLMSQARPDGAFLTESGRPPLETGEAHLTAMAIRAIQLYAPPAKRDQVGDLVSRSKKWLEGLRTNQQQELAFQLLGMQWCGSGAEEKSQIAQKLIAMQDADGGWAQLPTMKSDAYATGQALYALFESGTLKAEDGAYQKGLYYLLKAQEDNGAWIVQTRAYPLQPFVNSDFPPYDEDQFISATATNWATMALLEALPDKKS